MDIHGSDLVTVGLLVALEGLLSADNALVMAIMVLGLPRHEHKKALRYGLIGGFTFRIIATLLAVYLIRIAWVKLLGGLYLLYLTYWHFCGQARRTRSPGRAAGQADVRPVARSGRRSCGSRLVNLAFSIDSILVAVAMSPKTWVVITGGILGIVAMRLVVGQLLSWCSAIRRSSTARSSSSRGSASKLGLEYLQQRRIRGARDPAVRCRWD